MHLVPLGRRKGKINNNNINFISLEAGVSYGDTLRSLAHTFLDGKLKLGALSMSYLVLSESFSLTKKVANIKRCFPDRFS